MKTTLYFIILVTSFPSFAKLFAKKSLGYFELQLQGETYAISAVKTSRLKTIEAVGMVPRGAAVLTPAGALKNQGIQHIIHVAPGAMTETGKNFNPTLKGLRTSILNALELSTKKGLPCLAVPFIGGGIFLHAFKMTKEDLARDILRTFQKLSSLQKIVFVTWGQEDTEVFKKVMAELRPGDRFSLAPGSSTDHKTHKCETIVNAANMEVRFGGGISGVIGNATEMSEAIDAGTRELIQKYYLQK